jgi:hypothetical protein
MRSPPIELRYRLPSKKRSESAPPPLTFHVHLQRNSRFGNDRLIYWCDSISQKGLHVKYQELSTKPLRYRSYIVRCWQEHTVHAGQGTMVWRFSLQDPRTHQRRGFATLEALLVSLQEELADDTDG